MLILTFIIVLKETIMLMGLLFLNIIMIIDIDWKKISSFIYHSNRVNRLPVNTQVWLKGICKWRNLDNLVTITWRIISINITKFSVHNDQRHVYHIAINNSLINLFVFFFIYYIIKKINKIQLLWQPRKLILFPII